MPAALATPTKNVKYASDFNSKRAKQDRDKRKALTSRTGVGLVPGGTNRQSAGFPAEEQARPSSLYRKPQPVVNQENTFLGTNRPTPAAMPSTGDSARDAVIQAVGAGRNDLYAANELRRKQIASDKAFNYENFNIQRGAANEAARAGGANIQNTIDQATNGLVRGRDEEISGLTAAQREAEAGFGRADALAKIEEQDRANKLSAQFANLGTLAGSQFNDAAIRFGAFTQADREGELARRVSEAQRNSEAIARQQGFFGEEIGRVNERGAELGSQLYNQQQIGLSNIATSEDRAVRETQLLNERAMADLSSGLTGTDQEIAKYMYGFQEADRDRADQAARDRSNDIYREAALTGMFNGAPTMAAREVDYNRSQDQLAKERQREIDRQAIYDRLNLNKANTRNEARQDAELTGMYQGALTLDAMNKQNSPYAVQVGYDMLSPLVSSAFDRYGENPADAAAMARQNADPSFAGAMAPEQVNTSEIDQLINELVPGDDNESDAIRRMLIRLANQELAQLGQEGIITGAKREGSSWMPTDVKENQYYMSNPGAGRMVTLRELITGGSSPYSISAKGYTNEEIAQVLGTSPEEVAAMIAKEASLVPNY